jgi:hypothetical protein
VGTLGSTGSRAPPAEVRHTWEVPILNPCQFGSEKKPAAPDFFAFNDADLATAMGIWTPQVSLEALGISILPQSTADFCAQPPEFNFPVDTDYLALAAPTLAYVNGAYQRFRNLIYANKWIELSQCRDPVAPAHTTDPPYGFVWWLSGVELHIPTGVGFGVGALLGLAPRNIDGLAYRLVTATPEAAYINVRISAHQDVIGTEFDEGDLSGWAGGPVDGGAFPAWTVRNAYLNTNRDMYGSVSWFNGPLDPPNVDIVLDVAVRPMSIGTIPDPPVVEGPPSGFPDPPAPDDCTAATLASICAKLDKMSRRIDFIDGAIQHTNAALVPLAPAAIDPPVDLEDNPPTGDGSPPGTKPVVKPAKAVGAVVTLSSIPEYQPRRGTDPTYWPSLGHVAMLTEFGPMPSQLIKHNPMVLLPIPVQVTALGFDLAPGVRASIQWLDAPK